MLQILAPNRAAKQVLDRGIVSSHSWANVRPNWMKKLTDEEDRHERCRRGSKGVAGVRMTGAAIHAHRRE